MQAEVDGSTEAGRQETIEAFRIIYQQQRDAVFNASEIELDRRLARHVDWRSGKGGACVVQQ